MEGTPVSLKDERVGSRGPVFVIGAPRSGTSALAWGLARHKDFITGPESDFLLELFGTGRMREAFQKAYNRPDETWLRVNDVSYSEFCFHLGQGVRSLFESRAEGKRWIDSSPSYTLMAGELALMVPAAKFLHVVRDGRAVVCSMLNCSFTDWWRNDIAKATGDWSHFVRCGLDMEYEFPDRVMRVEHRRLLHDAAAHCGEILDFLDAAPCPEFASFMGTNRVNSSYDNVDPGDVRAVKSVDRLFEQPWAGWTTKQLDTFWKIAGETMHVAGFDRSPQ